MNHLLSFATILLVVVATALVAANNKDDNNGGSNIHTQHESPTITLPPPHFPLDGLRPHMSRDTLNVHYNTLQARYVANVQSWFSAETSKGEVAKLYQSFQDARRAVEVAQLQDTAAAQMSDGEKLGTQMLHYWQRNESFLTYCSRAVSKNENEAVLNSIRQAYNHALLFQSLAAPESLMLLQQFATYDTTNKFINAITMQFGSVEEFKAEFKSRALKHFGSGWLFLVVGNLVVDGGKPIRGMAGQLDFVDAHDSDTSFAADGGSSASASHPQPLMVIDLWEHAWFGDYPAERGKYVDNFFAVVDWRRVARRYEAVLESGGKSSVEVRASELSEEQLQQRSILAPIAENDAYPQFI